MSPIQEALVKLASANPSLAPHVEATLKTAVRVRTLTISFSTRHNRYLKVSRLTGGRFAFKGAPVASEGHRLPTLRVGSQSSILTIERVKLVGPRKKEEKQWAKHEPTIKELSPSVSLTSFKIEDIEADLKRPQQVLKNVTGTFLTESGDTYTFKGSVKLPREFVKAWSEKEKRERSNASRARENSHGEDIQGIEDLVHGLF